MTSQRIHILILCEDNRQDSFIRRYLEKRGYSRRNSYVRTVAINGYGSGEQHVRDNFLSEVKFQRNGGSFRALIVVTDADLLTIQVRRATLLGQIPRENERRPDERIAVLVPKRNIETWIKALNGAIVNEVDDYKRSISPQDVQPAVIVLVERRESQPEPDANWPSSLQDAYTNELPRLNKP